MCGGAGWRGRKRGGLEATVKRCVAGSWWLGCGGERIGARCAGHGWYGHGKPAAQVLDKTTHAFICNRNTILAAAPGGCCSSEHGTAPQA